MSAVAPRGLLRQPTYVRLGHSTSCYVSASADGKRVLVMTHSDAVSASLYLTPAEARALGAALIQQAGGED